MFLESFRWVFDESAQTMSLEFCDENAWHRVMTLDKDSKVVSYGKPIVTINQKDVKDADE